MACPRAPLRERTPADFSSHPTQTPRDGSLLAWLLHHEAGSDEPGGGRRAKADGPLRCGGRPISMEEGYRPYRRSARRATRARRVANLPDNPRPARVVGMKLHLFPPDTSPRRRRIRLLTVALLAVTAWAVVSVRQADMGLADYRTATGELLEELPYLTAAGRAVVARMLKAAVADVSRFR